MRVVTSAPVVAANCAEPRVVSVEVVAPVWLVDSLVAPTVALVVEVDVLGEVVAATVVWFSLVVAVVGSVCGLVLAVDDVVLLGDVLA